MLTCSQTHRAHSPLPATGSNRTPCTGGFGAVRLTALILCTGHALVIVADMVCFCLSTSASIGQAVLSGTSYAIGHMGCSYQILLQCMDCVVCLGLLMAWCLSIWAPLAETPVPLLPQREPGEILLFRVAHTASGAHLPRDPGTRRLAAGVF